MRIRVGRWVWISSEGLPDRGSFITLLSDDSLFTKSALKALLRGRFRPAVLNGQPIPQRVFQAILFRQR